jgi:hypothetical protein
MMDLDIDISLKPSEIIYPCRAIMLDVVTEGNCYNGTLNARCVGISAQQSEDAPGAINNNSPPYALAIPTSSGSYPYSPGGVGPEVPIYGPGRKCLIDIDPTFAGQIRPNDLIRSSNTGYGTLASPTGPWNQWIIALSLSFANGGQSCNVRVELFSWLPTGS